jgi:hypothetical protein
VADISTVGVVLPVPAPHQERLDRYRTAVAGHAPAIFKKRGWNPYALGLGAIVVAMLLVYVGVMRLPGGWSR